MRGIRHIHDHEAKSLVQFFGKQQPGANHRIGKCEVEGQVEGAGTGFVGGQNEKRFIGPFFETQFSDARPQTLDSA